MSITCITREPLGFACTDRLDLSGICSDWPASHSPEVYSNDLEG